MWNSLLAQAGAESVALNGGCETKRRVCRRCRYSQGITRKLAAIPLKAFVSSGVVAYVGFKTKPVNRSPAGSEDPVVPRDLFSAQ